MRRKEERGKQCQTNNKAKQHSTPKAVSFPKKNELPRVGLKPTTLYTLPRQFSWLGPLSHAQAHTRGKKYSWLARLLVGYRTQEVVGSNLSFFFENH